MDILKLKISKMKLFKMIFSIRANQKNTHLKFQMNKNYMEKNNRNKKI